MKNEPFIMESWSTEQWLARKYWVNEDGTPNLVYLRENYGDAEVPIFDGCDYSVMKYSQYIDRILSGEVKPSSYLKDWHFQNSFGTAFYFLHPFMQRDWVNCEEWSGIGSPFGDDYRFVYHGVQGSWTKLHSDVVVSHSWSANICGRKQWLMVPPGKEGLFRATRDDFVEDMRARSHLWSEAKVISFIQEPGEIVFVPSNWYHQVHNISDTISINHNWINSTNISMVVEFLKQRKIDVKNEIADCSDMFTERKFSRIQIRLLQTWTKSNVLFLG
ncbi:unnamed protein product [Caenorhabditis auriculariae]|uniref:Jumonji domain-containing protein 4 n=1 Tax=Caenorhabditis auriculariae TaxID=2777116 RepID=A0A8S1H593_9PELO|nr:unnamed protein product [Caenorhabditis auriculariae]